MATRQVLAPMPDRLAAAAQDVKDAGDAYKLAVAARDRLVVAAADDGMSHRAIAAAIGQRMGNVSRILAKPDDDDE